MKVGSASDQRYRKPQTRASSRNMPSRTRAVSAAVAVRACTTPYQYPQLRPPNSGFAGIDNRSHPKHPKWMCCSFTAVV